MPAPDIPVPNEPIPNEGDADEPVRVTALFEGRVQGVGFRWRTRMTASEHPVSGAVRNLADGRVEVVAEGGRVDIERFLDAVRDRMGGLVTSVDAQWSPASGDLDGFVVVR